MNSLSADAGHELHGPGRIWLETSCYVDAWIVLLSMRGLVPASCFGFAVTLDWEADQFTFLKIPYETLETLHGIETREMTIFRPLGAHVEAHLADGRIVLAEVDAFHLPDTRSTTYRRAHQKTTIGLVRIDRDRRAAAYVHNSSWSTLTGDDYDAVLGGDRGGLPLYAETVRFGEPLAERELREAARSLLARQLVRRPSPEAVAGWGGHFLDGLAAVLDGQIDFHDYAFNTTRQLGAGFELLASHLEWLDPKLAEGISEDARAIAAQCKTIQFRCARAIARRTLPDIAQGFAAIDTHHRQVIEGLRSGCG